MPSEFKGDAQIVRIALTGHLTDAEIGDLSLELASFEAGLANTPDRLTDLSLPEQGHSPYATIQQLAERSKSRVYPNRFRSAIVAPRPLDYGLTRIFQTLGENPQTDLRIFKTRAEAEVWLATIP